MSQPVEQPQKRRPAHVPAPASADAAYLMSENYRYREKIRDLREELKKAQGMAPDENSVVLSGDDAAKYREFKLSPAAIAEKLTRLATLETEVAGLQSKVTEHERQGLVQASADAANYDSEAWAEVVKLKGLIPEIKEVEKDGAKQKVAYVRTAADAEPVEVKAYAQENLKPFLRALQKDQPGAGTQGQVWTEQKPGSRAPEQKQTDQDLENEMRQSGLYSF